MRLLLFVFVLLVMRVLLVNAQYSSPSTIDSLQNNPNPIEFSDSIQLKYKDEFQQWSHLTINSDSRIYKLLAIKKSLAVRQDGIEGYRIQVFQGPYDEGLRLKAKLLKIYPQYEAHLKFITPDARLRVGDFRTKSEAIKVKYLIEKDFPNPFIVDDFINFPKLEE